jgi:hypothetical protein
VRRREFIAGLGSATAWPMVAHAQSERVRRIGVLMGVEDADNRAGYAALVEALQRLGWTDGRNVQIPTKLFAEHTHGAGDGRGSQRVLNWEPSCAACFGWWWGSAPSAALAKCVSATTLKPNDVVVDVVNF